jgi:acetoacetate decarboxylase
MQLSRRALLKAAAVSTAGAASFGVPHVLKPQVTPALAQSKSRRGPFEGMPRMVPAYPPTPQLLKDVWMLIVGYSASLEAIRDVLPQGLEANPAGTIQMNMYVVPDAAQTSGFGAYSLTYLTAEVAGHDSLAGNLRLPGRYFAYYWNSSNLVRTYAREAVGIPAMPGRCTWVRQGNTLRSTLTVDDKPYIETLAAVSEKSLGTLGGHLNYYSHRQFPTVDGGQAAVSEVIEIPIPFIADLYEAQVESIAFLMSEESHAAARLRPLEPLKVLSVVYGKVTFTYSQGRVIRDLLQGAEA